MENTPVKADEGLNLLVREASRPPDRERVETSVLFHISSSAHRAPSPWETTRLVFFEGPQAYVGSSAAIPPAKEGIRKDCA
jgi:hypothetical protein